LDFDELNSKYYQPSMVSQKQWDCLGFIATLQPINLSNCVGINDGAGLLTKLQRRLTAARALVATSH
jgi:hypothetical protein